MGRNHGRVTFKEYSMGQLSLPTDIGLMIPESHLVRVVNAAVERMNIEPLLKQYKGGGTSSYHPKMMLKVLVYAYTQKLYSSRQIAKALRENVQFIWLSGNNHPDFRTINRFRGSTMKAVIEQVFGSLMALLIEGGYVKLQNYFLDGTKIEANANRYSFVWGKSTRRYKQQLQQKVRELLAEIEEANEQEQREYGDRDLEEMGENASITAEQLDRKIEELNRKLAENPKDRPLKKAVRKLEKHYLPRVKRYEQQEQTLGNRKSYSKTDKDATFMRMKEDQAGNRELRPAYNVQIGTEDQFIVGFSVHQKPGDTTCMVPHLEKVREILGQLPGNVVADAGYGSEENYEYLEHQNLGNYVKHAAFAPRTGAKAAYRAERFQYDPDTDEFTCPDGKPLRYIFTRTARSDNGYVSEIRVYECGECVNCEHRSLCTGAKGNRQIRMNPYLKQLSQKVITNLHSEVGRALSARRRADTESVFGRLKANWSFRRFLLRGLEKVTTEWGLLSIAHNMAKMWTVLTAQA